VPSHLSPPTYFETNDFTAPFQLIVNTYGIPRYREVNPGLFAIIFFPFLFGVMFGDIAHGGALFLFSLYMVKNYQQLKDEKSPLEPLLPLRFLLSMMGFFAFFSGFIYNDFASNFR
jgi:V-type H+-transporting ATPase subunit a